MIKKTKKNSSFTLTLFLTLFFHDGGLFLSLWLMTRVVVWCSGFEGLSSEGHNGHLWVRVSIEIMVMLEFHNGEQKYESSSEGVSVLRKFVCWWLRFLGWSKVVMKACVWLWGLEVFGLKVTTVFLSEKGVSRWMCEAFVLFVCLEGVTKVIFLLVVLRWERKEMEVRRRRVIFWCFIFLLYHKRPREGEEVIRWWRFLCVMKK